MDLFYIFVNSSTPIIIKKKKLKKSDYFKKTITLANVLQRSDPLC